MKHLASALFTVLTFQALASAGETQSCTLKMGRREWTSSVHLQEATGNDALNGRLLSHTFSVQKGKHVGILKLVADGENAYNASVEDFGDGETLFGMRVGETMSVGPLYYDGSEYLVAHTKKFKISCKIERD